MYNNTWRDITKSIDAMCKAEEETVMNNRCVGMNEVRPQKYDMSELDMLEAWLEKNHIYYERRLKFDGEQIIVYESVADMIEGNFKWDVIIHCGSYGHEHGLLEYYNNEIPDVIGGMTAEDVINYVTCANTNGADADGDEPRWVTTIEDTFEEDELPF